MKVLGNKYVLLVLLSIGINSKSVFSQTPWAKNLNLFMEPINSQSVDSALTDTFSVDLTGINGQMVLAHTYFGLDTLNNDIDSLFILVIGDCTDFCV